MTATPSAAGNIMARLRAETRTEHEAVETTINISNPALTLRDYCGILTRFYGYYRPVEDKLCALSGWAERGLDLTERLKAPLLEADLAVLVGEPLGSVPVCRELPPLDAPAECFGCLYVLEGATLGGQLISRHVLTAFGVTPDRGGRFFRCYGDRTGAMWRTFGAALTRFAGTPALEDRVVAGAVATFRTLTHWSAPRTVP